MHANLLKHETIDAEDYTTPTMDRQQFVGKSKNFRDATAMWSYMKLKNARQHRISYEFYEPFMLR